MHVLLQKLDFITHRAKYVWDGPRETVSESFATKQCDNVDVHSLFIAGGTLNLSFAPGERLYISNTCTRASW